MKMNVEKELYALNVIERISREKQNKYAILRAFDGDGNLHDIYVKTDLVPKVANLNFRDVIFAKLCITYKTKFPKIELLDLLN